MSDIAKTVIELGSLQDSVVVYRPLVKFTGSLKAAMMLSQLLHLTPSANVQAIDKQTGKPETWIVRSDKDFREELSVSRDGVRAARRTLTNMGFLKTQVSKFNGCPTVHYRLDLEALETS